MTQSEVRTQAYKFFKSYIEDVLGLNKSSFYIKIPFYKGSGESKEEYIAMFEQELKATFYVELYSKDNSNNFTPKEPKQLYKWIHNKFLDEYQTVPEAEGIGKRWLIPVKELMPIDPFKDVNKTSAPRIENGTSDTFIEDDVEPEEIASPEIKTSITTNGDDVLMIQLTARDYYAMMHNKPVSNKQSINNLINENVR